MDKDYLFVLNPISGEGDDREEVKEMVCNSLYGTNVEIWETTGKDDVRKVKEMLQKQDWDGVLVGGGDGTVKMVVEAILGMDLPLGIIPLGSANGLATGFGIHGISDACHAIKTGKVKGVDLWRINEEICIHLSDFGFNAGLVKKSTGQAGRGMMSYFKSSVAQFTELRPYQFEIHIKGETFVVEARMLVIANGNKYGTGALINPSGKIDDGKFEVIALNPEGIDEIVSLSVDLFKGTLESNETVKIWKAEKAEVKNLDGADFQIDGEVMPQTESISIKAEMNKVNFFYLE
ncbi:YegS/Rv2252/BmrU family lipid kinase [Echinicola sp. CAU 1574]|uniref:YegS/Rv2252/BmrU family lipid kinase n=1 Tax=Echinicola arenosa TaxID=2774144 RepID=A0ABR9AI89_9BACT|nr:YegS/Rv2252/BmrU family lipid kinase [Echinicola arenosa]MBD8487655.1 YegS/Rv2252/BmrU family lipid kinase [Echinicola arenosa]